MVIVLPFSSLSQCKRPSNAKTKNHSQLKAKRRVLHSFRFLFKQIHSFPPQRFNLKQSTDTHGIHIQTSPFPAPLCCQHRDYFRGIFHAPRAGAAPAASPGSPPEPYVGMKCCFVVTRKEKSRRQRSAPPPPASSLPKILSPIFSPCLGVPFKGCN